MTDEMPEHIKDPLETKVWKFLTHSGHKVKVDGTPGEHKATRNLDFFLPEEDVYVEVCAYHTPRKVEQMSRADNVVLLQGDKAVDLFCRVTPPEVDLTLLRYALNCGEATYYDHRGRVELDQGAYDLICKAAAAYLREHENG